MANFTEQIPFSPFEFAENPEPRCPCILLLDTSGSMSGRPISELNAGLEQFKDELMADAMAAKRVELAAVTFGPVRVLSEFQSVEYFFPERLAAGGDTPMGEAVELALNMLRDRKSAYQQNGISYYRPWVFLITDGAPTDEWRSAAALVREGEQSRSFMFFAVAVEGANLEVLGQISTREVMQLKGLRFRDLFSWLSNSLSAISHSNPGDGIKLLNPKSPEGWNWAE